MEGKKRKIRSAKNNLSYTTAGNLKEIIADGVGINRNAIIAARLLRMRTSGFTEPDGSMSVYTISKYNLKIMRRIMLSTRLPHTIDGMCLNWETDREFFIRKTIQNIRNSDGVVIVNPENQLIMREIIGFCVTGRIIDAPDDYPRFSFYHWADKKTFVIKRFTKASASNLRNFIIVNNITRLCVIGGIQARAYSLTSFFEKAFRIRLDKVV